METPILLGWWNLIFVVPFGIALLYLFVYTITGLTFGDPDVEAGADHDHDVDHDHDLDHGPDHHVEKTLGEKPLGEKPLGEKPVGDTKETPGGKSASIYGLLGVGRVPVSLIALVFLLLWGVSGFTANAVARQSIGAGPRLALVSIPAALVVSVLGTGILSRAIGRYMPMQESYSKKLTQLIGRRGTAILPIDQSFGLARVNDGSGGAIQVACRVGQGQSAIAASETVELLRFDAAGRFFYVASLDQIRRARTETTHA